MLLCNIRVYMYIIYDDEIETILRMYDTWMFVVVCSTDFPYNIVIVHICGGIFIQDRV